MTYTLSENEFKGDFWKLFSVKVEVEKEIRNMAFCHDLSFFTNHVMTSPVQCACTGSRLLFTSRKVFFLKQSV